MTWCKTYRWRNSDGVGGTAAIQFATPNTGLALTFLDFYVV